MNDSLRTSSPPSETPTLGRYFREGQPDWNAIDFDVLCSRCGYNLKMLTQPRCPECGLVFDWWPVLDRSAWRSDFLFEHHATRRPVLSYLRTLTRSLRPIRFWKQVSIHYRVHGGPLLFMFAMAVMWFFALTIGLLWLGEYLTDELLENLHRSARSGQGWPRLIPLTHTSYIAFRGMWNSVFRHAGSILVSSVMVATAFGGTLGLLCTLRQTLGRCKVRSLQLLRVMSYAASGFCIVWPVLLLMSDVAAMYIAKSAHIVGLWHNVPGIAFLASFFLGFGFYVGAGLKHYLQLPRPYTLAFTAALVGDLLAAIVGLLPLWF